MKKMLFLFLLSSHVLSAQSIKEKTKDKFTGVESIITTTESLAMTMGLPQVKVFGAIFDDPKSGLTHYSLYFIFPPSMSVRSLKTNESEVILIGDGQDPVTLRYAGAYKIYSSNEHMHFYASLDEDEMKELQGKKFTDMRTPSHDYKIKPKQQDMISKIVTLLIENKPMGSNASTSDDTTPSLADELKKLKDLLDAGALTQEEYDAAKKKLLEK